MTPSDAPETSPWLRLTACLAVLATLAACGGTPTQHRAATAHYSPSRYYPPPGPASDPWGPYITEASGRFGVPQTWIRSVMRQESGGQEDVISWAGAMGLMQVMPQTYEELRARYNLGDDPYDPHNNIMAGTAYLREMYDRYGSPGFLAAYNAGPNRLDRYLASGTPLPDETVNYVASIAPRLGPGTPMSGPLAVYAGGAVVAQATYRPRQSGCDPDAAYNPDGPCTKLQPPVIQTVSAVPYVPQTARLTLRRPATPMRRMTRPASASRPRPPRSRPRSSHRYSRRRLFRYSRRGPRHRSCRRHPDRQCALPPRRGRCRSGCGAPCRLPLPPDRRLDAG